MGQSSIARDMAFGEGMQPLDLLAQYYAVRGDSEWLCLPLAIEDYGVQSLTETSPPKWHLAHTTWFFETFLLKPFDSGYREFHPLFAYLFNSYYDTVGAQFPRPQRGLLSRPTVEEVRAYRMHVDTAMERLLNVVQPQLWPELNRRMLLGLHHEQQHQELLLTDIKHNFSINPMRPAYREGVERQYGVAPLLDWIGFDGGEVMIGYPGGGFCFDNELPRHRQLLAPYRLASRTVTNGEFLAFMADGGYRRPELWMADGWAALQQRGWSAPLYWEEQGDEWWYMTLAGMEIVDPDAPVCHISFYEADAYARWVGHRLPDEREWEHAAMTLEGVAGNLREAQHLHPVAADDPAPRLQQMFGDVWEWTSSPYAAYPGYRRDTGAFGEYNGKFMCNQMVLRGGSCVTPSDHIRPSYRNFFYPWDRWQFSGIRLAEDGND